MTLPDYRNLTPDELEFADHYAEIGDTAALRRYRELSKDREDKKDRELNRDTYA